MLNVMKRLLLTFLLVLLPLQFAQAAMCPYCCENQAPFSTQQDDGDEPAAVTADDAAGNAISGASHRCGFCNLSGTKFVAAASATIKPFKTLVSFQQPPTRYQSYIPLGLDRPNWMLFA